MSKGIEKGGGESKKNGALLTDYKKYAFIPPRLSKSWDLLEIEGAYR